MRWNFIGSGFALMFLAAYLDNVRGPLLPVLSRILELPYSAASGFFIVGNVTAVVATFLLIPLTRRLGERYLAVGSTAIALAIPAAAAAVLGLPSMLLLGALVGTVISLFGTLSNILVIQGSDDARRARFFCGLHMLYGFGSLVGPAVVGLSLGAGLDWRFPFWLPVAPIAALLCFFAFRFRISGTREASVDEPAAFGGAHWLAIALVCFYTVGETLTTTWLVTFLVESRGFSVAQAAPYLSALFLLMGATRAACFLGLAPAHETAALWLSLALPTAALALGHAGCLWALPFAGLCGPFFPVAVARVSRAFPTQSRPMMIAILACVQCALAATQWGMGALTDRVGVAVSYRGPIAFLVAAALALWLWRRFETGANRTVDGAGRAVFARR